MTAPTTQPPSPLVSTAWLAERLDDPHLRIIEVSSAPDNAAYLKGHLPGALWQNWKALCWHDSDREFPTPETMAARLGSLGVSRDTTVVLCGDPVQYGSYAFWALTMTGHPHVRLLDGARAKWMAEGRPLSRDVPRFPAADCPAGAADPTSRVGREDVRAHLGRPGRLLLDVRSPAEYRGERVMPPPGFDHGAERFGRIPGARHLFFRDLLNEDDTFKSREELQAVLASVEIAPGMTDEVVTYCRLSHRATIAWIAMRHILGLNQVRIYDGSWTEWGSIVGYPVER